MALARVATCRPAPWSTAKWCTREISISSCALTPAFRALRVLLTTAVTMHMHTFSLLIKSFFFQFWSTRTN